VTRPGAETAVTMSAVGVFGIFAYRKLTELSPAAIPQTGHFVLGFMTVYITLSMIAAAAPELGAMFALLVLLGDLLTQGQQLVNDLDSGLRATASYQSHGSFATFTPTTTG